MTRTDPTKCAGDTSEPGTFCDEEVAYHVDFGDEVFHFCSKHYNAINQRLRRTTGKSLDDAGRFYRVRTN